MLPHLTMIKLIETSMRRQGVSQRGLSAKSGVNRSNIRRFMAGSSDMSILSLSRILHVLGHRLEIIEGSHSPKADAKPKPAPHPAAPIMPPVIPHNGERRFHRGRLIRFRRTA